MARTSSYYGNYFRGSNSYGKKNTRKNYSYGSNWDYWGSYFNTAEDNDDKLVVKDPENYSTPTTKEIEKKAGVWTKSAVDQIKELARVCYFKMIGDKEYLKPEYSDLSKLSEGDAQAITQKKEIYDKIYENYIPGFTPLEQATAIYQQISKADPEYAENGEINNDLKSKLNLNFDREIYTNPNINEQLNMNEHSKNKKMSILNKVSIIGKLGSQFKVEKEINEKIVNNSDTYSKKIMRDYAQIAQIELYQKLFPNFSAKFLMKDLVVNVPVDKKEQKQKIIIILDFSGSMDEEFKQDWVNAILIDRFRYVMQGEAEVFFSYFVHDADKLHFQHVHDRESVIKFWQTFSNEPDGGGTRVGDMVERIAFEIKQKRLMNLNIDLSEEKPEILVINDGNDRVGTDKFNYKVNAICLEEQNNQLKNLCIATKGKQVHVDYDENIIAYSEEGEEIINKGV